MFPIACATALRFEILCGLVERRSRERDEFGVNLAYTAAYVSLWLLVLFSSRQQPKSQSPVPARNQQRPIYAALVVTFIPLAAALPIWASSSAIRSHVIGPQNREYETCCVRIEGRGAWHAGAHATTISQPIIASGDEIRDSRSR